jgi:cytochrome c oxidase subunit II
MKKLRMVFFLMLLLTTSLVQADGNITNWLQQPATPLAQDVRSDFMTTVVLTLPFLLLPQILLVYLIWKYRASRGHTAATFHENVKLEIAWTVVPALTLIMIAIPAYRTLRRMDVPPRSDLVVEVIGHQFFWEYRYPRFGVGIADEPLVVPADKVVTLNCTSVDVIHSFWVPAFGIKQDANPGRITHTWFKAGTGRYKGQCAELCGTLHAQMLIDVRVVPDDQFEQWIAAKSITDSTGASAGHADVPHGAANLSGDKL